VTRVPDFKFKKLENALPALQVSSYMMQLWSEVPWLQWGFCNRHPA